jgi:hypothetical protein
MPRTMLLAAVLALSIQAAPSRSMAGPIDLIPGDITQLAYTGYETFHNVEGLGAVVPGDYFDGIFQVQAITNPGGSINLSGQLAQVQLTGYFRFTVTGGSSSSGHIEFGLNPGDGFSFYVEPAGVNAFNPSSPNAVALATSGTPWLALQPGSFFDSVNDVTNGVPLNRTWADIALNQTGYGFGLDTFATQLGVDPTHTYNGVKLGDDVVQAFFENHSAASDLAGYTYKINGDVYVNAIPAPEPASLLLVATGLLGSLVTHRRPWAGRISTPDKTVTGN